MHDTAAHLVDRVLPDVPYRQWVLSLPRQLRFLLAYRPQLVRPALRIFLRSVFAWQGPTWPRRRKAPSDRVAAEKATTVANTLALAPMVGRATIVPMSTEAMSRKARARGITRPADDGTIAD
jgi:hypothetical protein